jgi:uncharacterized membrane protein (DUF2068 family)
LYIPVELYELVESITSLKLLLLMGNAGIVWYLAQAIRRQVAERDG